MLTEESLIVITTLVACACVILGTLELVAPTRPRRPPPAGDPPLEAEPEPRASMLDWGRPRAPAPPAPVAPEPLPGEPPIERLLILQAASLADDVARERTGRRPPRPAGRDAAAEPGPPAVAAAGGEAPAAVEPDPRPGAPVAALPGAPPVPGPEPALPGAPAEEAPGSAGSGQSALEQPLARIAALLEANRLAEAAAEASAALETGGRAGAGRAALWGALGQARHGLGDLDSALTALKQALAASPPAERPEWRRRLAGVALESGRALLEQAAAADDVDRWVRLTRAAVTRLETGLELAPDDAALREAAGGAREALWAAYGDGAERRLNEANPGGARRLLEEALADRRCPPEIAPAFREMVATALGREAGQLLAEAVRLVEGTAEEAMVALDRAETFLAAIPPDVLPARRRRDLERRLWWAYTKLGLRSSERGEWDRALEPLLRALALSGAGGARHGETRIQLVRVLAGVVESRGALVEQLATAGDRDGALALGEMLRSVLDTALERGITPEELAPLTGRIDGLLERAGVGPAVSASPSAPLAP
jgi:tetratricopeptide (TPR) repeat protein